MVVKHPVVLAHGADAGVMKLSSRLVLSIIREHKGLLSLPEAKHQRYRIKRQSRALSN